MLATVTSIANNPTGRHTTTAGKRHLHLVCMYRPKCYCVFVAVCLSTVKLGISAKFSLATISK